MILIKNYITMRMILHGKFNIGNNPYGQRSYSGKLNI